MRTRDEIIKDLVATKNEIDAQPDMINESVVLNTLYAAYLTGESALNNLANFCLMFSKAAMHDISTARNAEKKTG